MLREILNVRQHDGEPHRRWFTSADLDLFVWIESGEVVRFQLTYDKGPNEKAVTWRADTGRVAHDGVDDGEGDGTRATGFKQTPILVPDGALDAWHVCGRFLRGADAVPPAIRNLVCATLTRMDGNTDG